MQWPFEEITKMFLEANERGESLRLMASSREAALFRYAINNRRRKLGSSGFTTRVRDRTVIVTKTAEINEIKPKTKEIKLETKLCEAAE